MRNRLPREKNDETEREEAIGQKASVELVTTRYASGLTSSLKLLPATVVMTVVRDTARNTTGRATNAFEKS